MALVPYDPDYARQQQFYYNRNRQVEAFNYRGYDGRGGGYEWGGTIDLRQPVPYTSNAGRRRRVTKWRGPTPKQYDDYLRFGYGKTMNKIYGRPYFHDRPLGRASRAIWRANYYPARYARNFVPML